MKIKQKLTIQFTFLVSMISMFIFIGIYFIYQSYVSNRFFTRLRSKAITTAEILTNVKQINADLLKQINESNRDKLHMEKIIVLDSLNTELYRSNDLLGFVLTNNMIEQARSENEVDFLENEYKIIAIKYRKGILVFAGAIDLYGNDTLRNLRQVMMGLFILLVLLVGFAGWFFAGKALQPISEVIKEVNSIYPQNLNKRLNVYNESDEIGALTITFNQLLNRTEEAFKQQRFFISNVSHELKNPLTKIISQLDVILLKNRTTEEYKETIKSVLEDVQNLSKLSKTLLELSKITEENQSFLFNDVRIDEIIWESRELLIQSHPYYIINVIFGENILNESQLNVSGNEYLIKIAILNLMENGCKFSDDSKVEVTLNSFENNLLLNFTNRSNSISNQEKNLIFQPFYRSQKDSKKEGYGVGLSLVDRIIRLHRGSVELASAENEMASFLIKIPLIK